LHVGFALRSPEAALEAPVLDQPPGSPIGGALDQHVMNNQRRHAGARP
jgi:hypothetical protein